eukprot:g531.t1
MEKYRRKQTAKEATSDDEIRVTAKGRTATYVSYASKLFNEKEMDEFTLKATGAALATAVTVAEVIKRRFKGLHQITKLGSVEVVDEWEPLEEGLDPVKNTRNVSFIEITLSKKELDTKHIGYQEPLDESLVVEMDPEEMIKGGPRKPRSSEDGEEGGEKKRKGKGKGKGKGKKGKGKGKEGKEGKEGGKGKKGKGKGKKGKRSKSPGGESPGGEDAEEKCKERFLGLCDDVNDIADVVEKRVRERLTVENAVHSVKKTGEEYVLLIRKAAELGMELSDYLLSLQQEEEKRWEADEERRRQTSGCDYTTRSAQAVGASSGTAGRSTSCIPGVVAFRIV